jgi:dihydroorotate dehydrogenase electron transfer subunit
MKQLQARIIHNTSTSADFFEMSFEWDSIEIPLPGQFFTVRASSDPVPLLRRPFAFSSFDTSSKTASCIYQKRGRATKILAGKQAGETVDIIGPLGKPFPLPENKNPVIAIAGGIGLGPVLFLTNAVKKTGHPTTFIFGCRNKTFIPGCKSFTNANPVICTDDGSAGYKGMVSDYLLNQVNIASDAIIYACGPMPMLKACHEYSINHKIECKISVEQVMACGVGACMGCAVKTKSGYVRACKEGPVFDSREIVWEGNC